MRTPKILLGIWLVVFALVLNGCNWFTGPKTRPAPIRRATPMPTRNIKTTPGTTPGKTSPGVGSLSEKQLIDRVDKIEQAARGSNWTVANREVNSLGMDMTRFRPATAKGKSLREMARFDGLYVKLQTDVKTKNKAALTTDAKKIKDALKDINSQM